jgi:hypothetical protein
MDCLSRSGQVIVLGTIPGQRYDRVSDSPMGGRRRLPQVHNVRFDDAEPGWRGNGLLSRRPV